VKVWGQVNEHFGNIESDIQVEICRRQLDYIGLESANPEIINIKKLSSSLGLQNERSVTLAQIWDLPS
jgi:hypothetical protein